MKDVTTVYRCSWLLDYIIDQCDKSGVSNTAALEERVINSIGSYLSKDQNNVKKRRFLMREVRKIILYDRTRYRKEATVIFSDIVTRDDEGEEQEYEPVDVLANVESEVMKEATVDLLAQADRRKRLILIQWANGNTMDSDISLALAREIGGNSESHRKAIQRFRIECKRALLSAAI